MKRKNTTGWGQYMNECVVVDTNTHLLYIGTLKNFTDDLLVMENADVHDTNDGASTKEVYIWNTRKNGVHPNRKSVMVKRDCIVSISRLADVVEY